MIIKIKIKRADKVYTILTGNSDKSWEMQFREYCHNFKPIEIIQVDVSFEKWIGWGGLKWCDENIFQQELNREGCQEDEPDNPNPRKYENMRFTLNTWVEDKVRKIAG